MSKRPTEVTCATGNVAMKRDAGSRAWQLGLRGGGAKFCSISESEQYLMRQSETLYIVPNLGYAER